MPLRRSLQSVLAVTAVLASSCSMLDGDVGAAEPVAVAEPVSFTVAGVDVPTTIDPAKVNPLKAIDVMLATLLFEGLTTIADDGTVGPGLADSWQSDDGTTWTFALDENAVFSNGRAISASDVVDSLERARTAADSIPALSLATIDEMTVLDGSHFSVTTDGANWELPALLASPAMGIVPTDFDPADPVSSGHFEVATMGERGWSLDATNDSAPVDSVQLVATSDDVASMSRVESGDVDMAIVEERGDATSPTLDVDVFASLTAYLGVRQGTSELAETDDRESLVSVLDRAGLVDGLGGEATLADSLVPLSTVDSTCAAGCDVVGTSAGELDDPFVLDYLDTDVMAQIAGAIAIQAARAGVEMEAKGRTPEEMEAALAEPEEPLVLFGVAGLSETPDSYLGAAFGSKGQLNVLGMSSKKIDDGLAAARATEGDAERAEAYEAVEALVIGLYWATPLVRIGKTIVTSDDSPLVPADLFGSQLLQV